MTADREGERGERGDAIEAPRRKIPAAPLAELQGAQQRAWVSEMQRALGNRAMAEALNGAAARAPGGADPAARSAIGAAVRQAHAETGGPLDAAVKEAVEGSVGGDLRSVRVHESSAAATAAARLKAGAVTLGGAIVVGGAARTGDAQERRSLLAHEAVHAAQQGARHAHLGGTLEVSHPFDAAEVQAADVARELTGGSRALRVRDSLRSSGPTSAGLAPVSIQRDIREKDHDIGSGKFSIDFTATADAAGGGEDGRLSFLPSKTSPESDAIRFIQIVRVLDAAGAPVAFADVNAGIATMDQMSTATNAKKNVAGGFAVDQTAFPAPRTAGKADAAIEPFYDVTGAPIAGNATGVHRGATLTEAVLVDTPTLPGGRKVSFVSSVKGADNGVFYGTALWGFETFDDKASGLTKVKNEYHSFRAVQGETTDAALKAFNEFYHNPGAATAPAK